MHNARPDPVDSYDLTPWIHINFYLKSLIVVAHFTPQITQAPNKHKVPIIKSTFLMLSPVFNL